MNKRGSIKEYKPYYTSPFTQAIFKRVDPQFTKPKEGAIVISVELPILTAGQSLVLVGSTRQLGEWSPAQGVVMCDGEFPTWRSPALECSDELLNAEFKFVIIDTASGDVVAWEQGDNRRFAGAAFDLDEPRFDAPKWMGAGVAVPLFSLRSERSWGVGEIMDLKMMVDWAAITGQRIIQILPINDTTMGHTWEDSYPYNANSIFALHPQYLSVKHVGELLDRDMQVQMEVEAARLNTMDIIDYEAVNKLKNKYMRMLYAQQGDELLASKGFEEFFEHNSYWLTSYALFSFLREKYQSINFSDWGDEARFSQELLAKYSSTSSTSYKEIAYYYYVQYNLHLQLVEAREYAHSCGVVFKGDIPIGVSRTSVDVWVSPELFHLSSQAGAPPDDFSVMGQNWGFPTYNWVEMAKDGYQWWGDRFRKMAEYFDAYRIDHILGFFRIWEIPLDAVHGLLGHFSPAMPLSRDEMRNNFGFYFEERYQTPAINDWLLELNFGPQAPEIKSTYLDADYRFKSEYDSQLKIKQLVKDEELCEKLMSLFNEVLFIEDPYQKGHYHPRISAQQSYLYRAMSDYDKQRYDQMYNHFYYHRHNDYWQQEAMAKLPALVNSTNMLTCGEDLGMIPDCVPAVMESQSIISLEIQRMPKDPSLSFGQPWAYPYMAVCTTSTHDMNPVRAWLLEDHELSARLFKEMFGVELTIGDDIPGWACELIVKQHLNSPAMLTILPLQDWLSIDEAVRRADPHSERINVPANSRHYWRYRMHLTIEQLIALSEFNDHVREMITTSSRY